MNVPDFKQSVSQSESYAFEMYDRRQFDALALDGSMILRDMETIPKTHI